MTQATESTRGIEKHGIDHSRMVLFWYGPKNPLVANDTKENQAKNRRVEIVYTAK